MYSKSKNTVTTTSAESNHHCCHCLPTSHPGGHHAPCQARSSGSLISPQAMSESRPENDKLPQNLNAPLSMTPLFAIQPNIGTSMIDFQQPGIQQPQSIQAYFLQQHATTGAVETFQAPPVYQGIPFYDPSTQQVVLYSNGRILPYPIELARSWRFPTTDSTGANKENQSAGTNVRHAAGSSASSSLHDREHESDDLAQHRGHELRRRDSKSMGLSSPLTEEESIGQRRLSKTASDGGDGAVFQCHWEDCGDTTILNPISRHTLASVLSSVRTARSRSAGITI
jgi:hypothetical protein